VKLVALVPFSPEEIDAITPRGPFNYNVYFMTEEQLVALIRQMRKGQPA
jgi:hypothetical protein